MDNSSVGAKGILLTQIKQDFVTPANAIFDYLDIVEKAVSKLDLQSDDELNQILKMQVDSKYFPMIPTKGQGILSGKLDENGKIIPDNQETVPEGLSVSWLRRNIKAVSYTHLTLPANREV